MADQDQKELFEMTPEELDSLEGTIEEGGEKKEEPAEKQETQESGSEKTELPEEEGEEGKTKEKGSEPPEKSEEGGEELPEGKTGDPLKDTQRAFHEKAAEVKKLREELEQLKKQLQEKEGKRFEGFEELTEEEFEALKAEDPEAAFEYLKEKEEYERYQQQLKDQEEQAEALKAQEAVQKTWENIVSFVKEQTGLDPNEKPEEFQKYLQSEEFQKLDQFVTQNFQRQEDGTYTVDQLKAAYRALFFDKLAAHERLNGREEAVDDIAKAGKSGSKLDKIPKETPGREKERFANVTPQDILNFSEKELEEYEKWLEEQGVMSAD